jgi:molecular chaperone GrpE (heat shock protein)
MEANHPENYEKLQQDYERAKEDYEILDRRTKRQMSEMKDGILSHVSMKIQSDWEMMARMIELVMAGEREAKYLAPMWNALDQTLWTALKTPYGSKPVK